MATNPVRSLRKVYGITRKQLAKDVGCSASLIEAAEIGVLHWQADEATVLLAISKLFLPLAVEELTTSYHHFAKAQYEDARRALEGGDEEL